MAGKKESRDWEQVYQEEEATALPWYIVGLDHDFQAALDTLGMTSGAVLDLGTGPGTQAIALAQRGFHVTATDIAAAALEGARAAAQDAGQTIDFLQDDIVTTKLARGTFDAIFDRGCFHVLRVEDRPTYVANIAALLKPGGRLFLKRFSHKEPGDEGPHRLAPDEIRATFTPTFQIESITDSIFRGNRKPLPHAIFSILRK